MSFKFKIKDIKTFGKLGRNAARISKILSDLKGVNNEERAFLIVQTHLRVLIRHKADYKKLGLKGLTNIEFWAGTYGNDPGKDIWIKLLFPEGLAGERIDIEIKSSKKGMKKHRERYDTGVVLVNKNVSDLKVAKRIYNIIFEHIRRKRNSGS